MSRRVVWISVLALTGCGSHGGGATAPVANHGVKLVSFDGTPPAAIAGRPTSPAPACRASQLRVDGDGVVFVPGTRQGGTGGFVLRNRGAGPCRLTGRPKLRFVGGASPPPQRQRALPPDALEFPKLAPPARSLLALAPGHGAVVRVDWENWCTRASVAAKKRGIRPPTALRVALPERGGNLDVDYNAVVACEHADRPSVIGVRPFAPQPLAGDAFTTAPLIASLHPLDGGNGTLRGRRGQDLRFAVQLRNGSSTETVRFDRCPLVAEKFAPVGATEAHRLNCRDAEPIRPHGALWFEMRVHVPQTAPLGPNGLFWRLDPIAEAAPQAVARVVVTR